MEQMFIGNVQSGIMVAKHVPSPIQPWKTVALSKMSIIMAKSSSIDSHLMTSFRLMNQDKLIVFICVENLMVKCTHKKPF